MSDDAPAIKARLVEYLKFKKLKMAQLEKKAGLANAYLRNSNGAIGAPKLRDILHACPDLDANWLLTGVGDMLKTCPAGTQNTQNISGDNAKGVFKGNMTVNETDALTTLTKITVENIEEIDTSHLPAHLAEFIGNVRELKKERDELSENYNSIKIKLDKLEEKYEEKSDKVDELNAELIQIYKEKAKSKSPE